MEQTGFINTNAEIVRLPNQSDEKKVALYSI